MANNQRNILKRTKCSRTGSKPCAVRVRVGLGVGALHKKPETRSPTSGLVGCVTDTVARERGLSLVLYGFDPSLVR